MVWPTDVGVHTCFTGSTMDHVVELMNTVVLPPSVYTRPYHTLSNGEQARVALAFDLWNMNNVIKIEAGENDNGMLSKLFDVKTLVIDEFTRYHFLIALTNDLCPPCSFFEGRIWFRIVRLIVS
jgi:hypothetical protein